MPRASVTDIHLCHRCPRLLAYRHSGETEAWKVGLKGTGFFPGRLFHEKIAAPFYAALAGGRKNELKNALSRLLSDKSSDLFTGLSALIETHIMAPVLAKEADKLSTEQIMALAGGIELWSRSLAEFLEKNREYIKPGGDLSLFFCGPEEKLEGCWPLPGGQELKISGACDTVLMDLAAGEAVVVEFKGLKAGHEDEDLIQTAVYAWLLKQKTGVKTQGRVFYLEEAQPEAIYPAGIIEKIEDNLTGLFETTAQVIDGVKTKSDIHLPPTDNHALCPVCPFDSRCDRDWGPRRVESGYGDKTEADYYMTSLIETLKVLKLPAEPLGHVLGPRLIRLKIRPLIEKGATVKKIMNRGQDLQIALSLIAPPLVQAQAGHLSLDIPRKTTTPLTLKEIWEKGQKNRPESPAAFPLGMAVDGSVVWADLCQPTMTSILVAGTAGSGKSVFLRSALIGLAMNGGSKVIKFTLIDPKRVTFTDLAALPHLAGPIVMDIEPALAELDGLVEEMEARYHRFEECKVVDINGYNRLGPGLAHHVVMVDEYADLITDKEHKGHAEGLIKRLSQKGRAAGIHMILSTQRPESKVVTPLVKANLQLKVALKVTSEANSRIILDESGADRLIGHGDMLVGGAIPLTRLQGAIPTRTEIETVLAHQD